MAPSGAHVDFTRCNDAARCLDDGHGGPWREMSVADDDLVELAAAIEAVREQLIAAQRAGVGQSLSFTVGEVEIEFVGEVKRVAGGGVGLKFWVISADGKAERSSGSTHKVKIKLVPLGRDGKPFRVASGVVKPPAQ